MPPQHLRQLAALMQTSAPGTTAPPEVGVWRKKEMTGTCQLVHSCSSENHRIRSSLCRDLYRLPASRPAAACSTAEALLLQLRFLGYFLLEMERSCLINAGRHLQPRLQQQ